MLLHYVPLHYLAVASLAAYLISSLLFILTVLRIKGGRNSFGRVFLILGFLIQTGLAVFTYDSPLLSGNSGYLFGFSWAIPLIYLIAGKHSNFPIIGAFVSPLSAFFFSASSYLSHGSHFGYQDSNTLLMMHVVPAFVSELCLFLALVVSSVYIIQSKRIKKKVSSAVMMPAPSLTILEHANQYCLLLGFLAMTLAILSGVFWHGTNQSQSIGDDPYQILAFIAWAVMAFLLHARTNLNFSAARVSKLTIYLGLLVLAGTLTLVLVQGDSVHNYAG